MARRGAVAAGHPDEVAAALDVLEAGGNAVDACVAGAFAAFVAEPNNAGLTGYGHLTAWSPQRGSFLSVDHGPRAPAAARPDLFELIGPVRDDPYAWPDVVDRRNEIGGLACGVPGAVAGLVAAHERAGRLPLERVVAPAVALAEAGVVVDWLLSLVIVERLADIRTQPTAAVRLLVDGDPPAPADHAGRGRRLDTSALAAALRRIGREGARAVQEGSLAEAMARAANAAGGILTLDDLTGYRPRVVEEEPARYGGALVATAEDDVGHELFGILGHAGLDRLAPGSADELHVLAEAFGHAFADALAWAGDPGEDAAGSRRLRSAEWAAARAAMIRTDRAAQRPIAPGSIDGVRGIPGVGGTAGTTQVAVADAEGGMAVVITTIGQDFGSLVYVEELGAFLNTAMANFDPRAGRPNSVAPGRMPLFAVPATIAVRDGRAVLACGGSGGYRITSGVVHATVNVLDHGLPAGAAVAAPRVWCQGEETFVDARVPAAVRDELAARGHDVVVESLTPGGEPFARVSLVTASPDGKLAAASDPPWHGAAAAR